MTERQKLFIRKEYERKTVTETTLMRDAVFNAVYNVNRRKGRGFKPLWKKHTRVDKQQVEDSFAIINEIEQKETGWVERIYRENGLKPPEKKQDVKKNGG